MTGTVLLFLCGKSIAALCIASVCLMLALAAIWMVY